MSSAVKSHTFAEIQLLAARAFGINALTVGPPQHAATHRPTDAAAVQDISFCYCAIVAPSKTPSLVIARVKCESSNFAMCIPLSELDGNVSAISLSVWDDPIETTLRSLNVLWGESARPEQLDGGQSYEIAFYTWEVTGQLFLHYNSPSHAGPMARAINSAAVQILSAMGRTDDVTRFLRGQ